MNGAVFDRFDRAANEVLQAAVREAVDRGEAAVGTEHLLVGLATADPVTARLLAEAGVVPDVLGRVMAGRPDGQSRRRDHDQLLATLGIDLSEVRRRAEQTFGSDAIARAAPRTGRRAPRRSLWSYISCGRPLPRRHCDSPLGGAAPILIPRVKRLLDRASRAARPRRATPGHLLLALVTGDEPAGELLTHLGVDLSALAAATRRQIAQGDRDEQAS